MPYPAVAVANSFLKLAEKHGEDLSLMKLLKLAFFAHAWHLAIKKQPLVSERPEAWKFGPVFPSIYHAFKGAGAGKITKRHKAIDLDALLTDDQIVTTEPELPNQPFLNALTAKIWSVYGKFGPFELSELTHQKGTPWWEVWHNRGGSERMGTDIPDDLIQEYFAKRLA